jgi:NADH dehydrogenase
VVGGGPTGVELAGTLAEIARHTLASEFRRIDPRGARVRLIEAGPALLPSFPPDLQAHTRAQLERLGVEVLTGQAVTAIDAAGYRLGETPVPCRTVLWAAGVAASPLGRCVAAGREAELLDRAGRVKVAPDLSVPGHPELFVAGDLALVMQADGRPVPGVAPAAKQMGTWAARNLRARARGRPTAPFVYRPQANLATIGRRAAVADLGGLHLSGVVAWWFWLAAHVFFLIGFRNRLMVLLDWAWAYWTHERGARIVLGTARGGEVER